jgi:hypothetical protein
MSLEAPKRNKEFITAPAKSEHENAVRGISGALDRWRAQTRNRFDFDAVDFDPTISNLKFQI